MSEFDMIKTSKPNLNAKTLVNYRNLYKRLKEIVGDKDITSLTQDEVIKSVNDVKGKKGEPATPSVKTSLLSLALVLREAFELDVGELKKAILKSRDEVKTHTVEVNNVLIKDELPSVKELTSHLEGLYTAEKWRPYIMNWLMINLGVRNKDLNLEIVDKKSKEELDPKKNYLIVNGKTSIDYQRGDFKTVKKFGDMENTITNKKLINAVRQVMDIEGDNKYLLSLGHNTQIAETSLNKWVSKHTLNGMGQGKIFKAVIASASKIKEKKIAGTRGTALGTVEDFYNVNKVIKKKGSKKAKKEEEEKPKETEALKEILAEAPKKKVVRKKKTLIIQEPNGLDLIKDLY